MPFLDKHRYYKIHSDARVAAKTPAIFLDRDGVLVVEKHYLRDPEQVELCVGVPAAIASLMQLNLPIVVVTNQSGIGRSLFEWADYHLVHQRMLDLLQVAHPFAAVYANAYLPDASDGSWRKPNPGMLLQAAEDLNIDLEASVMVGDKCVDMEAAARAGVKHLVHVKTGHGAEERPKIVMHCPQAQLADSLAHVDFDVFFGDTHNEARAAFSHSKAAGASPSRHGSD